MLSHYTFNKVSLSSFRTYSCVVYMKGERISPMSFVSASAATANGSGGSSSSASTKRDVSGKAISSSENSEESRESSSGMSMTL